MGEVHRATDQQTGETVAIKFLLRTPSAEETARFWREVKVLASLNHPGIVRYIDHGVWPDSRPYFAMEWLEGEDLDQLNKRQPLGMADAVEVTRRIAQAMAAVHARGLVHRDIKLSNIFVPESNIKKGVKLIDFGVVKPADPDDFHTHPGSIIGTPYFMAPEQAIGGRVDPRTDVYSIGAVLFRLITGRRVFDTTHVIAFLGRLVLEDAPMASTIRMDVPELLDHAIAKTLARNPDHRPANASVLAQWLSHLPAMHNKPPNSDASASAIRRKPPPQHSSAVSTGSWTMPGAAERRVVGVILASFPWDKAPSDVVNTMQAILGDEARIEMLQGGQLVAGLGLETTRGDEAVRAARAALMLATTVPDARIAIATGHAVTGRQGLAGEALEQAAVQLERADPGGIRVSKQARTLLQGRFVVRLDDLGAVLVHEDIAAADKALLLGQKTPTVGRESEIELLSSVFHQVMQDRSPRAVLITGPTGVGKSRLRAETVSRLQRKYPHGIALTARGDPMQSHHGLSALGKALRSHIGLMDGDSPEVQTKRLQQYLDHHPHCPAFSLESLSDFVGIPKADRVEPSQSENYAVANVPKLHLVRALEALVRNDGAEIPYLLVLEDLHLMDELSRDIVDKLLGASNLPLVVFALARLSAGDELWQLWQNRAVTRIGLAPLSHQACEQLVAHVLPDVQESRRTAIAKRSGGNVLFLEELVRNEAEGQHDLPMSVQVLIQARLDHLNAGKRHVVRAASVFGRHFWTGGVNALMDRSCEADLEALAQAEFFIARQNSRVSGQQEWAFVQSAVQETAYSTLLDDDRITLHRAAYQWLESVGYEDYAVLARHAQAGNHAEQAAVLFTKAAGKSYLRGQPTSALELTDAAIACANSRDTRAQALYFRAQVLSWLGRYAEQLDAAEAAVLSATPHSKAWTECNRLAASALRVLGHGQRAEERLGEMLQQAGFSDLPLTTQARLFSDRALVMLDLGQPDRALRSAHQGVRMASSAGDDGRRVMLRTLEADAICKEFVGDFNGALQQLSTALQQAEQLSDTATMTRLSMHLGHVLTRMGQFEQSRDRLEQVLQDARVLQLRAVEGLTLMHLGQCYGRLGDLDQALRLERRAQQIGRITLHFELLTKSRLYEATFLAWRATASDLTNALNIANGCRHNCQNQPCAYVDASSVLAQIHLSKQDLASCVSVCQKALSLVDSIGMIQQSEEALRLTYTQALLECGYHEQALEQLAGAYHCVMRRSDTKPPHLNRGVYRLYECRHILELAQAYLHWPNPFVETNEAAQHGAIEHYEAPFPYTTRGN